MIISVINRLPSSGKTSVCIALANRLNDMPDNVDKKTIIFDCDPSLTSYTKYDTFVKKNYRTPPDSYQVVPMPLDDDTLVFRILSDVKDKTDFFLFDFPSDFDEWMCMRILVSSNFIVLPYQPTEGNGVNFKNYLQYILNICTSLAKSPLAMRSRLILVPVLKTPRDKEVEFLKPIDGFLMSPPIDMCENVLDSLDPIKTDNFDKLPYNKFNDFITDLIKSRKQTNQTEIKENKQTTTNQETNVTNCTVYEVNTENESENF